MSAPRAFRIRRDGELCGDLGEGPGPFVTAVRSALPAPELAVARFTSRSPYYEGPISEVLVRVDGFDAAVRGLEAAGFALEAVPYAEAFGPRRPR